MSRTQTSSIGIGGMTCAACVGRVERALSKVPGVQTCSVNLATESAHVQWQEGQDEAAVLPVLRRAIRDAGYEPRSSEATWSDDPSPWQGFMPIAFGLVLSLPLTFPMFAALWGSNFMLPAWLQLALATPVQFILGARFYKGAWHALKNASTNMDVLVALGTSSAWLLSVWLGWGVSHHGHEPHLYFEGAAVVITLVRLGKWLEERIKRQTTAAIRALHRLRPQVALLEDALSPSGVRDLPVDELRLGDVVLVKAGAAMPADGCVVSGRSSVNESMLTGEPLPVSKQEGDAVTGGSLNGEGLLRVRVTAVGAQSMLARIISRVEQAQAEKAPIQRLVDRVSEVFVPAVLLLALITLLAWRWWGVSWDEALVHAVSVMVIACPCAMGLATPTALVAGTGLAAGRGILIRDAQVLELAHSLQAVVFDKTGTLTRGEPVVDEVWTPTQGAQVLSLQADAQVVMDEATQRAWSVALALQQASDHPLAKAVIAQAQVIAQSLAQGLGHSPGEGSALLPAPMTSVEVLPGRGVKGQLDDAWGGAACELSRWSAWQDQCDEPAAHAFVAQQFQRGATVSALVQSSPGPVRVLMLMAFTDQLKPNAAEVVHALKAQGLQVWLMSGDQSAAVHHVAKTLQLAPDFCLAALSPEGKAEHIAALRAQGLRVAFVGDGINDAPALAAADVGIAMASAQSGSDVVLSTAGMTLLRGDLTLVPVSMALSSRTFKKIRQNLFWAFAYNVAGLPLAALGVLSPMVAGAAMALSSVSVMLNSAALRRSKL